MASSPDVEAPRERKKQIALIAQALDQADISCILWGTDLAELYGVPMINFSYSFIVSDTCIAAGYTAIRNLDRVVECCRVSKCMINDPGLLDPLPTQHLHLLPCETLGSQLTVADAICLWPMSQIFHPQRMPDTGADSKDLLFASDPQIPPRSPYRGCGPFPASLHPVRILNPYLYVETVLRLIIRDKADGPHHLHNMYWNRLLNYFGQYVDGVYTDFFDYTKLQPQFRWFWKKCVVGRRPELKIGEGLSQLENKLLPWPDQTISHETEQ